MKNIFEQFVGADLDRLVKCIEKIRAEDLVIDQYTQAGINKGTGNVYVWSEDWTGCVYCSIGMDVSWSYSCPQCGEEFDFDTEADCQVAADMYNGQCSACFEGDEK
jgi:predicted RNA-binding Zn-ribbon protein involved in translation (DUF1610 family)